MRISDWSSDVCSSDLGQLAGLLAVADPIRESARGAIDALRSDGLRIVMLTGDNATTANAVARIVGGLDEVRAELKPEDKAQAIAELKASGRSEEHTSELQSLMRISYAVFCLKKKKETTK